MCVDGDGNGDDRSKRNDAENRSLMRRKNCTSNVKVFLSHFSSFFFLSCDPLATATKENI